MKGYIGWALLAVSLGVAYQGWQTTKGVGKTAAQASRSACSLSEECTLSHDQPTRTAANFLARKYTFKTSMGPVTVTCKRQYLVLGGFECRPAIGST